MYDMMVEYLNTNISINKYMKNTEATNDINEPNDAI